MITVEKELKSCTSDNDTTLTLTYLKHLATKGKGYFPKKSMRRKWFKQTCELLQSGKHMLITGKFPVNNY